MLMYLTSSDCCFSEIENEISKDGVLDARRLRISGQESFNLF